MINLIKSIRIKYYQNSCQKIKSGKLFLFSALNKPEIFFVFSRLEKYQTFIHIFPNPVGTLIAARETSVSAASARTHKRAMRFF